MKNTIINEQVTMSNGQLAVNNCSSARLHFRRAMKHCSLLITHFSFVILLIASCSFVLIACRDPLSPPKHEIALPADSGSFSLVISGTSARTILPTAPELSDFAVYTLAFTATSGGTSHSADRTNATLSTEPVVLIAGTYDLTVSAYKDAAKTRLMARGSAADIIITAGTNTTAGVALRSIYGEGGTSGNFSWNITLGSGNVTVSTAAMTIKDSGGTQQGAVVDVTGADASGSRSGMPSGMYTVVISIEGTENGVPKALIFNEILYIYSELTSPFTFTFSDSYFYNTHYNITFDENYAGGGSSLQTVEHNGTYTAPAAPTRSGGYIFEGWNTAADGSGTAYNAGDSITGVTADITLYAQWRLDYLENLRQQLLALPTGTDASPSTITLDAATFTTDTTVPNGGYGWSEINTVVKNTGRYVRLDLSNITFEGNTITGANTPNGNYMNIIKDNAYIKGIILPDGLETIGSDAFYCSWNITSVTIPDSVTSIGLRAFYYTGLTSVTIGDGVASIEEQAFYACRNLTSVTIGGSVTSIGAYAFLECKLTSVTVPDSVISIGNFAFSDCENLTSVDIGSSVTSISSTAFYVCSSFTNISVDAANTTYASEDGVLFNKAKTTLILYPDGKTETSYTVPASVMSIEIGTFQNCISLTSISIPSSVTSIGAQAFENCSGLISVAFGRNGITFPVNYGDPNGAFPGNLVSVYTAAGGGAGTYTRTAGQDNWVKAIESPNAGMLMPIPAGIFQMGDTSVSNATPHTVELTKAFYMGKYEVTQAQYQAVMGTNPSSFTTGAAAGEVRENRPVEMVSWYDALVFCNTLSMMEGLTPAYSIGGSTDPAAWGTVPTSSDATWSAVTCDWNADGYRLPTEAEWEYACRAGTATAYYTGDTISGDTGWYTSNSGAKTHEVGKKPANAFGLYDMSGNVSEWCWDWDAAAYNTADLTDPLGASSGTYRILRGGSWIDAAAGLRSARRNSITPAYRINYLGFRVVRPQV